MLLAWPLFGGKFGHVFRLLAGFAAGAGVMLSPWLLAYDSPAFHESLRWIIVVMIAAGIVAVLSLLRNDLEKACRRPASHG